MSSRSLSLSQSLTRRYGREGKGQSLPPIGEKRGGGGEGPSGEKWAPRNWDYFKKGKNTSKMAPQIKSKFLAYEPPPKEIADYQHNCKQRLINLKKNYLKVNKPTTEEELSEKDKHEKLIGQLKAAEARNRIRIMRLRYESNRGQEINHLIMCQPTARKAVRLQALVPTKPEDRNGGLDMDKISRTRIESLLEDSRGLLTGRT